MTEKRNYKKLDFTKDEESKIIDFVKQNPLLFDPRHVDYKNKIMKDKLWNDIAKTMEKTGFLNFLLFIYLLNAYAGPFFHLRARVFQKMEQYQRHI